MVKMEQRPACDLGLASLLACSLLITFVSCTIAMDGEDASDAARAAALREEQQLSILEPFGLSYRNIHRMLRDENEPASYRGEIRYQQKRFIQPRQKRAILDTTSTPARVLNVTNQGLEGYYNSSSQFKGQFELISIMDLSGNHLQGVHLDSKFTQLRQLDISNNSLREQPMNLTSSAITLTTLDLSCNQFSQLSSGSFFAQQLPNLKHLNLAHNQLGNISRETFYNLYELETLLLSHNNITDIDYETFLALPNLQHLDLSHNRLAASAIRALQGIPDLVTLSIAHNPQVGAAMQEFVASWSLKELDASATGLCQVPAALAQSVRTLKLSNNWLRTINCGDMDSYPLLQYLDLSYSRIAQVEDDALGRLELLESLFLDHNQLMRVPGSLPTSLEKLFLQNNQIMDLQPQVFAGLVNLQILDLSGNRLLYLPPLRLPKLITLNLQSAGVESVSQSIVHTLPELRDLLLEDNPIKCSDLLGIAEWASPCRPVELGQAKENIDLKQQYMQLHNFYEHFKAQCGQVEDRLRTEDDKYATPPTCRLPLVPTTAAATATPTTAARQTMPKGQKSKTEGTMQSVGYNIAQLTAKTLRPTETTSLAKLHQPKQQQQQQQRQQMPGMPHLTATVAALTATATTTSKSLPTLTLTKPTKRQNNLATASSQQPTRPTMPANAGHVAASLTTATPMATTTTTVSLVKMPQTILSHTKSNKVTPKPETNDDSVASDSLLKNPTPESAATTTATLNDTSGQISSPTPHKHATLQLHIKDRHLIGTPLLMHKGDNLLVDAEQLLLPGTATVADAAETLEKSQQQQQQEQQRQPSTDKRQPEAIKGDIKSPTKTKKKPSLGIKKMTYSTKHATSAAAAAAAATTVRTEPTTTPATLVETSAATSTILTMSTTGGSDGSPRPQHQHGSVNTPKAASKQEMSTFAQLKAYAELKTESKPEHLLDKRQENQQTLSGSHPGVMLLVAFVLVIVLLAGLVHVYRCELPWQRRCRPGQMRPHLQRPFNENDDVHSFLHYQGSSGNPVDPARLQKWHHSTRREAPYSSPLHNLQARELQREQQKLQRCQQFYSASLASSSSSASGSSRSSLQSPCQEDSYCIEMAPSSPPTGASEIAISSLPMELLASGSCSSNSITNSNSRSKMAATDLGGTTIKAVGNRIMGPSSRRLGIW